MTLSQDSLHRSPGRMAKTRFLTDQPHNACDDQVDSDDVIQQPGLDEDQYAGDERKNRVIGGHECHGEPPLVLPSSAKRNLRRRSHSQMYLTMICKVNRSFLVFFCCESCILGRPMARIDASSGFPIGCACYIMNQNERS